ncbi:hypothetical protein RHMOL_Rhmol05G0296100 [Rhododendron molle]|uniref:Uncharacterized protein n=1 Tax=Rhododendron molle TaxID=49168 RepID=A0ACC0NVL9_RHOML|nr:hypothetical protein RHMOL_Rhmol05G0296100 [Rhododendron molle]
MEITPTEILVSQGENDYGEGLQRLTSTVGAKLVEGTRKTNSFPSASIYRVPKDLRKVNKSAYTPRLVAIGPLHRNDKHLQNDMRHVKTSYTNKLLSRQIIMITAGMEVLESEEKKNAVLRECLAEMKKLIDRVKECYLREVEVDEAMLVVDGCFILELLYRSSEGLENDLTFGNSLIRYTIETDLLTLENQIPFFVLEKLFSLTVGRIPNRHNEKLSLTDYVLAFIRRMMILDDQGLNLLLRGPAKESVTAERSSPKTGYCSPRDCVLRIFGNKLENSTTAAEENVESGNATYFRHILHVLHDGFLPRDRSNEKERYNDKKKGKKVSKYSLSELAVLSSASDLAYAGVKFLPGKATGREFKLKFTEPEGLFWWFRSARFEIPPVCLFDYTESILRNLIAFEQCCPGVSKHVTSYAFIMSMLVNTDKDVLVLEKAGVVSNYLGTRKNATALFNKLCILSFPGDHFINPWKEATLYSQRFWPKHAAHLRRIPTLFHVENDLVLLDNQIPFLVFEKLFQLTTSSSSSLNPKACRRARFVIPPLAIYDNTECYLRNLIAFELCCPGVSQNVTSYAFVMDMLVNFDEDVEVLEKAKVMRSYLGASKDATHLFNKLCKETVLEHYFADMCVLATKYSKRFLPKNMALLKGTYFDSPWTFIAFCVGFVAFVMSLVEFARDFSKKG